MDNLVVEDAEPTPADMEEAYYWLTITDYVNLIAKYGQEQVTRDSKKVARDVAARITAEWNNRIIVPDL